MIVQKVWNNARPLIGVLRRFPFQRGSLCFRFRSVAPEITNSAAVDLQRRQAIRLEYFTIAWNAIEILVAIVAGIMAQSIALIAFGLDSGVEMVSGVTLLWRFKQQRLEEERADSRAVKIVGITFFLLSAYAGVEAARDLYFQHRPEASLPGMILAVASLVVMPLLAIAKRRLARALGSRALAADSMETLFCSYFSATLLAGLALNAWLGWWWADPVAALLIAVLMVREGIEALE
jgi:divalent metal cation (Fe/Co/Zn/Cd) transporter